MHFFKALGYSILCMFVVVGCIRESDKRIRQKLIVILNDDLKAITSDIAEENLLDSVYYDIVMYKDYKNYKFTKKAEVDFYFLKGVSAKIVRKYRYHSTLKKWERYFNEYRFYGDK